MGNLLTSLDSITFLEMTLLYTVAWNMVCEGAAVKWTCLSVWME